MTDIIEDDLDSEEVLDYSKKQGAWIPYEAASWDLELQALEYKPPLIGKLAKPAAFIYKCKVLNVETDNKVVLASYPPGMIVKVMFTLDPYRDIWVKEREQNTQRQWLCALKGAAVADETFKVGPVRLELVKFSEVEGGIELLRGSGDIFNVKLIRTSHRSKATVKNPEGKEFTRDQLVSIA